MRAHQRALLNFLDYYYSQDFPGCIKVVSLPCLPWDLEHMLVLYPAKISLGCSFSNLTQQRHAWRFSVLTPFLCDYTSVFPNRFWSCRIFCSRFSGFSIHKPLPSAIRYAQISVDSVMYGNDRPLNPWVTPLPGGVTINLGNQSRFHEVRGGRFLCCFQVGHVPQGNWILIPQSDPELPEPDGECNIHQNSTSATSVNIRV